MIWSNKVIYLWAMAPAHIWFARLVYLLFIHDPFPFSLCGAKKKIAGKRFSFLFQKQHCTLANGLDSNGLAISMCSHFFVTKQTKRSATVAHCLQPLPFGQPNSSVQSNPEKRNTITIKQTSVQLRTLCRCRKWLLQNWSWSSCLGARWDDSTRVLAAARMVDRRRRGRKKEVGIGEERGWSNQEPQNDLVRENIHVSGFHRQD